MTITRRDIEDTLVSIQAEFLTHPSLSLTTGQARARCGGTTAVCRAVLDVLVEAGVLRRSSAGRYERHVPVSRHRQAPAAA